MKNDIIKINNLNYKDVFNEFSINIKQDKLVTISGPNNCGKTTLIRLLSRQIKSKNAIKILDKSLESYKITELNNIIQSIIPKEIEFITNTIEDEFKFYLNNSQLNDKENLYKKVIKDLKLNKYKKTNPKDLDTTTLIKLQLALSLVKLPKIVLIDSISSYLTKKEMKEIKDILKKYIEEYNLTIIMTTNNLFDTIDSNYLYIISESKIILEGPPIEVLQKDNILNKVGLQVPFMIDLSVKLRDYDLIQDIELDKNRMVDTLWK